MTTTIETIETLHSQRAPGVPVTAPIPATEAGAVPHLVLAPALPVLQPVAEKE